MNCLLLTSTSRRTLEFHLVCCLFIFPFLVVRTYLKWDPPVDSGGAAQIAQYFWQQYFGSLELARYVLWWTENQSPCSMLLAEMFRCCDTMIPFILILAESALKATLDQTIFPQKPSSWSSKDAAPLPPVPVISAGGTTLALPLCEQLLCWLLPDFPAYVVWATDKTQ